MKKNILFIWPQEPFLPQGLFKHFVFMGETAEYAKKFGNVKIFDLSVKPEKRKTIIEFANKSDYIFIPIEAYTAISAVDLAKVLKQNSETIVVGYGSAPCVNSKVFSPYFDYVLKTGHWQIAIKELVTDLNIFNKKLINGNVYDSSESFSTHEWCFPAFDLLPMEEYEKVHPGQIEFSVQRGCIFNCPFCSEKSKVRESKTYQRDPDEIVNFMKKNPESYYYLDATTFTQDQEWVEELCKKLEPLKIKWRTVTRINQIDENMAKILSKAGCDKIGFGVETFSKKEQIKFNKLMTPEVVKKHSDFLIKEGIIPRAFFILGLPGQTAQDIIMTQKKIIELGVEYRWKEYIPFEKVASAKTLNDFKIFERSVFPKHKIEGLSSDRYNKLLEVER